MTFHFKFHRKKHPVCLLVVYVKQSKCNIVYILHLLYYLTGDRSDIRWVFICTVSRAPKPPSPLHRLTGYRCHLWPQTQHSRLCCPGNQCWGGYWEGSQHALHTCCECICAPLVKSNLGVKVFLWGENHCCFSSTGSSHTSLFVSRPMWRHIKLTP